ncbi:lysin A, protease C39 domain [Gordonia phage ObLaDi]|uniref:Lysin A, protease C39 domain n=3 Tax=Cafassovirus TaxID=3425056 RepID=A0A9E7QC93_9CAUD|nr:lysin A, protease C39 domain [Gordonia phage Cafasso]UVK59766.1 lysin A, protease C39 domain [Gordonia phage Aleemily]UXE03750.1 lysin A, protease C39 domain [Gordonia phage ObLaDi]
MSTVLDYTYLDANLPKGPINPAARMLRRYRGVLNHQHRIQQTGYWCGPTTVQMILLARGIDVPQATLAKELRTTTNGTDYIGQFPPVLNKRLNAGYYSTDYPPAEKLWDILTASHEAGYGVACNIVARSWNKPPGYPNYTIWHYVPSMGTRGAKNLRIDNREVFCPDSANFSGVKSWWVPLAQMASLVSEKGVAVVPRAKRNILGFTDSGLAEFAANMRQLGES